MASRERRGHRSARTKKAKGPNRKTAKRKENSDTLGLDEEEKFTYQKTFTQNAEDS